MSCHDAERGSYNEAIPLTTALQDQEGTPPQHEHPQESVVRSATLVSIAVFFSRATGLVREMVMARLFGAGFVYDAFLLGFRIPNLTRDLFAEGALSSAFVPAFTATLATKGKAEGRACFPIWWPRRDHLHRRRSVHAGDRLRAGPGRVSCARVSSGAWQVRTGRHHDAHHVPVPAAGGAGRAGHGHAECLQSLRCAGHVVHVFQPGLGGLWAGARVSFWGRSCTSTRSPAWPLAWCWAALCNWCISYPA